MSERIDALRVAPRARTPRRIAAACAAVAVVLAGSAFCAWLYFVHTPDLPLPNLAGETQVDRVEVSGESRSFIAYVPPDLRAGAPLVIVLHGFMMDAELMRRWTGYAFDRLADSRGYVLAYPDGVRRSWHGCSPQMPFARKGVDDVSFMRALVASLSRRHGVDPGRVFVVGFSNGGQFAFRLLGEAPDLVAGAAIAGSSLPVDPEAGCGEEGQPRPVMLVAGTDDPLVPFDGGQASLFGWHIGKLLSAEQTASRLAARNGVAGPAVEAPPGEASSDGTSVSMMSWTAPGSPPVVLHVIRGGGHAVPQPHARFPRALGRTSQAFDMPSAAIAFFGL